MSAMTTIAATSEVISASVAALLTVAAVVGGQPARLLGVLAGGVGAGLAYLALVLLRPGQLGLGDAKLA